MIGMRQAMRIHVVGVIHAEFLGGRIHHLREHCLAACNVLRNRHGRIIARGNNDAALQIGNGHILARFYPHQRRPLEDRVLRPGILADRHHIVLGHPALVDLTRQNVAGHHLGQAGRRQRHVRVVFSQYRAAVGVHQQPGNRVYLGRRRHCCRHLWGENSEDENETETESGHENKKPWG